MRFKIRRRLNKQVSRDPPLFVRQSSQEIDVDDKGDDEFFNPAPAMKRVPDPPLRKQVSGLRGMFKRKKKKIHKSPETQLPIIEELTFNSSDHDGSWETDEIELVLEAREEGTETRRSLEECARDSTPYEGTASNEKLAEAVSIHCSSASEDSTIYKLMIKEIAQDYSSDGLMDTADHGECTIKRDSGSSSNGSVKDEADNFEIEAGPADHNHGEITTNRDTGSSSSDVKDEADNFEIEAEHNFSMRDTGSSSSDVKDEADNFEIEAEYNFSIKGSEYHVVETNDSVSVKTEYREDESQSYFSEVVENASSWNSSGEDDDRMGNHSYVSCNRTESTEVISREEKEQHSDQRASLAQSQHTRDYSVSDDGESLREMATGVTTTAGESTWTEGTITFDFDDVTTFDESEVYDWKNMKSFDSWLSIQNELKGGSRSDCHFCGIF
jgi:hypothetical protein